MLYLHSPILLHDVVLTYPVIQRGNFLTSWVTISFSRWTLLHAVSKSETEENHEKPTEVWSGCFQIRNISAKFKAQYLNLLHSVVLELCTQYSRHIDLLNTLHVQLFKMKEDLFDFNISMVIISFHCLEATYIQCKVQRRPQIFHFSDKINH
jgi:hypothetical protein